ncbi:hypothetical protein HNP50_001441 [Elizabethkingia anophelis]|nr:hypothetical protein M876_07135 [Elizabethkingia anophelis FMS-007]MCW2463423.1 hypothetical protein [Elizabethkingia anophelis]MCW2467108.1 hypothetical protein [Elizabethkingia anophelis]MCW2470744.1 hypothetical protein [Elizabethkingia anophelis]
MLKEEISSNGFTSFGLFGLSNKEGLAAVSVETGF